ncbi:conjugative transposon protein TraM [Chitinophaga barathri]|uniref:Conjugative transposon protein TraM n=1 Tax=Chitinophaga barathri TaxID=1647451 RepID=A0A3N4MI22_9BACT|nr:conjugative transposon protein TraM [Chitinophaga barathri]RPD43085.1 conjugative transposon protein TraM [Chitinophaga barathri]
MQVTKKNNKKAKIFLPLLFFPFCAIFFSMMGGGKDKEGHAESKPSSLNAVLPSPEVEGNMLDKMSLYKRAEEDSAKAGRENVAGIFDTNSNANGQQPPAGAVDAPFSPALETYPSSRPRRDPDHQVAQLQERLAGIQHLIDQAEMEKTGRKVDLPGSDPVQGNDSQFQGLQQQMSQIQQQAAGGMDAEMQQMKGMMETILDIQHPSRVTDRLKDVSRKQQGRVIPVTITPATAHKDYFGGLAPTADTSGVGVTTRGAFFGSGDGLSADTLTDHTAIAAVVHETQQIVSGAWIKLRLVQPVFVDGRFVPKGVCVWGMCSLSGERLTVQVTGLGISNELMPVRLEVYDYDANPGIRIHGSITREVSKEATDRTIQSVALSSLNPSIEAQAATAGLETAKNLLSRKVKVDPVTVKAGYPVLLRSTQTNQ